MKVVVSCSGKFHAFALTEQLQNANQLQKLFTAYSSIKTPWLVKLAKRVDKETIDKTKIKTNIIIAIGLKLYNNPHFWNNLFDRWVAFNLQFRKADVFIGWSGMCLHSLRVAQKKGMLTIVERGSSHIEYQNEILKTEYQKFGKSFAIDSKVISKELKEYAEADFISIPSGFVKNSFIEKGINENKLFLNNYGSNFKAIENSNTTTQQVEISILYLGALTIQKGLIYLFDALALLDKSKIKFKATFIGTIDAELSELVESRKQPNWHFLGQIPQYELPNHISQMDVAVQPSLQEGLSMVIPQILCCGVPVIATTNTGGADVIEENKTGFIIPIRNSGAIFEKIKALVDNKEQLQQLKQNAANTSDLTWSNYGNRYIQFLQAQLKK